MSAISVSFDLVVKYLNTCVYVSMCVLVWALRRDWCLYHKLKIITHIVQKIVSIIKKTQRRFMIVQTNVE